MGKYSTYMEVPGELVEDEPCLAACKDILRQSVVEQGLTPVGDMTFDLSEQILKRKIVDPFLNLPWWRRALVRLRLADRPEPYEVRVFGLRGVVRVAEDAPAEDVPG